MFLVQLLKYWRESLILILGVVITVLITAPTPAPVVEKVTVVEEVEVEVVKIVEKTKIMKPDGTVIEKEKVTDEKKDAKFSILLSNLFLLS